MLAGQPLRPDPPVAETVSPALITILDSLSHPAYVLGHCWDYLAWNAAADALFGITQGVTPYERNLVWQLFMNPEKRRFYPDWPAVAQHVIAEFRAEIEPYHGTPWIATLIDDLRASSAAFRQWWEQHAVLGTVDRRKTLAPPERGDLTLEYITLRVAVQPGLKLVIYTPPAEPGEPSVRIV